MENMVKLSVAGFLALTLPASAAETIANWGLVTGATPRTLCVYNVSTPRACEHFAQMDQTWHWVALDLPATGFFYLNDPRTAVNRLNDRVFVGGATALTATTNDWYTAFQISKGLPTWTDVSQSIIETDHVNHPSGAALLVAAETIAAVNPAKEAFGIIASVVNNNVTHETAAWGIYSEAVRANSTVGTVYNAEFQMINYGSVTITDPYIGFVHGSTTGLILGTGNYVAVTTGLTNSTNALFIGGAAPIQWNAGIVFWHDGIAATAPDSRIHAIELGTDQDITWFSAVSTVAGHLTVDGSAIMQAVAAGGLSINGCTLGTATVSGITCISTVNFSPIWQVTNRSNDATSSHLNFTKEHGAGSAVQSGDALASIVAYGYANGDLRNAASIEFAVAAAPSGSNVPSKITFKTTDAAGSSSNLMILDNAMHMSVGGPGVPVISSCGGSPSAATGSDTQGQVTEGTTATGCVISFKTAYGGAPYCTVTPQAFLTNFAYTISTTAITLVHDSASSVKVNWVCMGT